MHEEDTQYEHIDIAIHEHWTVMPASHASKFASRRHSRYGRHEDSRLMYLIQNSTSCSHVNEKLEMMPGHHFEADLLSKAELIWRSTKNSLTARNYRVFSLPMAISSSSGQTSCKDAKSTVTSPPLEIRIIGIIRRRGKRSEYMAAYNVPIGPLS